MYPNKNRKANWTCGFKGEVMH